MYLRVLNRREKILGLEDILIFNILYILGYLYIKQGKIIKAEKIYL